MTTSPSLFRETWKYLAESDCVSLIAKDLPTLIFMLLPGFIAAGVFYSLTAHPKASEFERLIQSLIFTSIIKAVVIFLKFGLIYLTTRRGWRSLGKWDADLEFAWSVAVAIAIGLAFAVISNHDFVHAVLRWIKFTARTSYPSEWYSAFAKSRRFVVLHLDGGRRLRGWPDAWPDQSDKGHFLIDKPEWLLDDNRAAPLYEVALMVIPAGEVKMVEFLKKAEEIEQSPEEIERVGELLLGIQTTKEDGDGSKSATADP